MASRLRHPHQDENASNFIDNFYSETADYTNAPRLLVISWDHHDDDYEDVLLDISLLIRIRAYGPTFVTRFRSHQLIEGDFPNVECGDCGHSINCGCDSDCEHEEAMDEAMCELHEEYYYLDALDDILANANPKWLKAFRKDAYKAPNVECVFDVESRQVTVYIRFNFDWDLT